MIPLDPQERSLLLDALRDDEAATLDRAVGTSFTLDLEALLLVPLAFALFDSETGEPDPVTLLAALQEYGGRIAIYCDAAHVKVPPSDLKMVLLLEDVMLPVTAPNGGSFHPKVWVLRYRLADGTLRHRVLVLSRNLTFDRSWDLVLRLDEDPDGDPIGAQVAEMLDSLNEIEASDVTQSVASSVRSARFAAPAPFESVAFHPIGLGSDLDPLAQADPGDRALVVSPFITSARLAELRHLGEKRRTLVSRGAELDREGRVALDSWGEPLTLKQGATEEVPDWNATLEGLHAKLYVSESEGDATWFVGSANATSASVMRNVEALVELHGPSRRIGVGAILSEAGKEVRFRSLLERFEFSRDEPAEKTAQEREEERLDRIARTLAEADWELRVCSRPDGFTVAVSTDSLTYDLKRSDTLDVRLVSRTLWTRADVGRSPVAECDASKSSELVRALAIRLAGDRALAKPREFVVMGRMINAPEDRSARLFLDLIPDAQSFIRLLFLMLAASDPAADGAAKARSWLGNDRGRGADGQLAIPLYESLVRAAARDPQQLVALDDLVSRLGDTEEGRERLPERFAEMWSSFGPVIERAR